MELNIDVKCLLFRRETLLWQLLTFMFVLMLLWLRFFSPLQKKSIYDLKSSGILEKEFIVGKVVQKSELQPCRSKEKNDFFYLAVADQTASVKMIAFGKDRYQEIREKSSYSFRNLKDEDVVKLTQFSEVSPTGPVNVPEELETEARRLIQSPVYYIEDVKSLPKGMEVSVEGTVTDVRLNLS